MILSKRQHRIVTQVIDRWRGEGTIDGETAETLHESVVAARFDWRRLARYSFLVAVACLVIAVGSALADEALIALLKRLFDAPAVAKCVAFAALAAGLFRVGLVRRARAPQKIYSNEAIFFLGVLALATAIGFLGEALATASGRYPLLFLLASILYALLGLWFPSTQVWVFGLLSLGAWMGTETGYRSGYGMYFLGMNYPLRFVVFGAVLTALGLSGERVLPRSTEAVATRSALVRGLTHCVRATTGVGLLYLFIALWILSVFGNSTDLEAWRKMPQYVLLPWAVAFAAIAAAAIWLGLREDDAMWRGFGLTFLFINLYTRYFEYFWDTMHKAIFFAVLAASCWYLGSRAEKIWTLGAPPRP